MGITNVILRADAGKSIGYGHFVRSLALAQYLRDTHTSRFATFNPSGAGPTPYQLAEIAQACDYMPIDGATLTEYDRNFLNALTGDEIVVLDNYYFTTEYQQAIIDKGCRLVCIDDMHTRHFVANLVITGSSCPRESFSLSPSTRFIGGINHAFLRQPFLVPHPHRESGSITEIVTAMGGADPYGLTNKMLAILADIAPAAHITVIAGDTVEVTPPAGVNVTVRRRLSASQIVDIFTTSHLGIFPASTICIEALACNLPVAAVWYVDNQHEFFEQGARQQLFLPLGNMLTEQDTIASRLAAVINSTTTLLPAPSIDFAAGRADIINAISSL